MKTTMILRTALGVALSLMIGWAYVSPAKEMRSKLYVDNAEGDDLTIVDPTTYQVLGRIPVGHEPHGLAASAKGDRIYVSVESTNRLLAIDPVTDKIIGQISGNPERTPDHSTDEDVGTDLCVIPLPCEQPVPGDDGMRPARAQRRFESEI